MKPAARDLELLQTIIENPDDDTPRLIYADWLEEHGNQARAEFIRAQCESARLFRSGTNLERAFALRAQYTELLRRHEKEWIGEFPDRVLSWTFERGFIEYVRLEAFAFLRHADFIFTNAPVRRLFLLDVRLHVEEIVKYSGLARLSRLYLTNVSSEDVPHLLRSPYLTELPELDVINLQATAPEMRQLRARFGNRVRF